MEIAVIGSGPVGIWTANLLLNKGHSVTLIEAGGEPLQVSQLDLSNYFFKTPSAVPENSHSLGGGSNLWMGRIGEFREIDFEDLPGVRGSDWPFKKDALKKHYASVAQLLTTHGMDDENLDRNISILLGAELPKSLRIRSWRFIDLGVFMKLIKTLRGQDNFDLKLHTFCIEISESETGKISLSLLSNGKICVENYESVIVCAGAIQSTALILRSSDLLQFDSAHLIGKGLMEHFDGYVGRLIVPKEKREFWKKLGSLDVSRKNKSLPVDGGFGYAISDDLTLSEGLLNVHLEVVPLQNRYLFESHIHSSSKYQRSSYLKIYAFTGYLFERIFKTLISKIQYIYNYLLKREVYSLWLKGEEIATPFSQISLSEFDNTIAVYNHQISQNSFEALSKTLMRLREIFAENDLGNIKYYLFVKNMKRGFYLRPNWHPMGALKMSKNPATGVVRSNFRFGNTKSVYVADSSIFPTGSNANPTFSALALASKMVEDNF
jgi:choline dehydrogenase-like flavoprotein